MQEYVDICDKKYTDWLKRIAIIKFVIKLFIYVLLIIGLVIVLDGLTPYIKGTVEWEQAPFTISQLNALLCFSVWTYLTFKAIKVYGKW